MRPKHRKQGSSGNKCPCRSPHPCEQVGDIAGVCALPERHIGLCVQTQALARHPSTACTMREALHGGVCLSEETLARSIRVGTPQAPPQTCAGRMRMSSSCRRLLRSIAASCIGPAHADLACSPLNEIHQHRKEGILKLIQHALQ